ncbi:MAG: AmmeMemoRadiSam system protein B [Phycisphaerales bacterium]|nr:AmmeMemoRadiSam system protein B [Phycisphaerales bacterium]
MAVRLPVVAGCFYPKGAEACRADIQDCLRRAATPSELPAALHAGIVPHAGWSCSGGVAAGVFRAIAERSTPEVVVLFGAVHRWSGDTGAVFANGAWTTPLGDIAIAESLARRVLAASFLVADVPDAHREEHSLEVQMPFVKYFFPHATILPIMVPPGADAVAIGSAVGDVLHEGGDQAVLLGTTDLTHYGPSYNFTPHGVGIAGLSWARDINDRRMIDLIREFATDKIVAEAREQRNACGPGAIVATLTAAQKVGARRMCVVEHTTSHDVLGGPPIDAVGYLGAVIGG